METLYWTEGKYSSSYGKPPNISGHKMFISGNKFYIVGSINEESDNEKVTGSCWVLEPGNYLIWLPWLLI